MRQNGTVSAAARGELLEFARKSAVMRLGRLKGRYGTWCSTITHNASDRAVGRLDKVAARTFGIVQLRVRASNCGARVFVRPDLDDAG